MPEEPFVPYRSMLFVPASRPDWMRGAERWGADALIFDLEDSVADDAKDEARHHAAEALRLHEGADHACVVRVNGWRTGELLRDLDAAVRPGLDGVILSKVDGPEDVAALDLVLGELEAGKGLPVGGIEIIPLTENARSLYLTYDICLASKRVHRAANVIVAAPNGDPASDLNLRLSPDGREWIPIGQTSALAARAAGARQVFGGLTTDVDNLELVRTLAVRSRALGATGAMTIHPSHVPILNEIYGPSEDEIAHARVVKQAMTAALSQGRAAIRHEGQLLDYAHLRDAESVLRLAEQFSTRRLRGG